MTTLKDIEERFEKELCVGEPFSDTMFSYRKEVYWKFLVQSIKDILEEIVPPERTADIGYDLDERGENWNDCRNEIKKQIEIILK